LDRLGDRWSSQVVAALLDRPHRFGELRRELQPVTHKVLTQVLRSLERDGLVDRVVADDTLRTVTYSLTVLGEQLAGPLAVLRDWAQHHSLEVADAQRRFDSADAPASVTALRRRDHER
jgi:DNA-binding HxlR family transcriptional regulator